ncbi:MAG: SMC-Scp complex subunit ScpB [Patescibacteria group bacterium]
MNEDILVKKTAELEALLFVHGEPINLKKIGSVLELEKDGTKVVIDELKRLLENKGRGLALVSDGDKIQIVTKSEFSKIMETFIKEELSEDLTPASLETLSLIAYFGPVSRSRLEYLRGVNSIFILRNLLLRGLVERFPDPEHQNTYLYRPTFDFLRHLGLKNREELPDYEKFQTLFKEAEGQIVAEAGASDNQDGHGGQSS